MKFSDLHTLPGSGENTEQMANLVALSNNWRLISK